MIWELFPDRAGVEPRRLTEEEARQLLGPRFAEVAGDARKRGVSIMYGVSSFNDALRAEAESEDRYEAREGHLLEVQKPRTGERTDRQPGAV
jgi:hypothetical protein